MLELRNPHSILSALQCRPQQVKKLFLPARPQGVWQEIQALAETKRVLVKTTSGNSAAGAEVIARESLAIEDLLDHTSEGYGIWLALDQIQDPQNLGSIFRTASFFGVRGIVLTREHSAPLTATAYDVACGGLETVPFAVVANLQRAFEKFKDLPDGWILGTSEHATESLANYRLDRHWLVVLGNEESGMRRLTQETCDVLCQIAGQKSSAANADAAKAVGSLNVSVAAGLVVHHFLSAQIK